MRGKLQTAAPHLHVRRCVCCGFDGASLRRSAECPSCGCDLRERPPRSYAEMEGLNRRPTAVRDRAPVAEHRAIERWLAVLFLLMVGVVAVSSLLADVINGAW
ncbi:MAG: hypothetical protein KDA22_08940 [Phycisphaerales bacterium]|nr:hypothetical protein [Phycisphaerales bacterium]